MHTESKRLFWVWADMLGRCSNKNHKAYHNYGGRGISVCGRWKSFANFLHDMGERPEGLTLDRKDNNKGYCPENCRWATRQMQALNKRIYKANIYGIGGILPRDDGFRVRLRLNAKIVFDKTVHDFFEACCLRKSAENKFHNPILNGLSQEA